MSGNIRIVILIRPEDSFCIYIHKSNTNSTHIS